MKGVVVILCLFILSKPIVPFLEYVAFFDYIKTELCINKDKPILKCNGKCHLVKQIVKTTESDENDKKAELTPTQNFVLYYSPISFELVHSLNFNLKHKITTSYNVQYASIAKNAVFRPPIFV